MNKKVVVIDCGHGYDSNGIFKRPLMKLDLFGKVKKVTGGKPHEDDYSPRHYREDIGTLKIGKATKLFLEEMGFEVHLTRDDERSTGLYIKEQFKKQNNGKIGSWRKLWPSWKWIKWFTKEKKADLFISIHTNAGGGTGVVSFYAHQKGKELSQVLCKKIADEFNLKIRRIKERRFLILREAAKGNAVLFEVMFHDHPKDLSILIKDKNINKIGEKLAEGIKEFLKE
jgi:N-acetylmuramoyl-L-alanine amidase